jgi:ribosomal protein S18 acetylase RimI-like enzyme
MTISVRAVTHADLDRVVDLDRRLTGQPRADFYRRRLAAQDAEPASFISFVATDGNGLAGFFFAHVLDGEFGGQAPVVVLDALGVEPDQRGQGVGRQLMAQLDQTMKARGAKEMVTQADWNEHSLIRFFAANGFALAPRLMLERSTSGGVEIDAPVELPSHGAEIDLSDPSGDDYAALSRDTVPVRSLTEADQTAIVTLDRKITGRDRAGYYRRKVAEVMRESSVRVSLVAEIDGCFAGFVMARVGYGEFGRAEPVAILDTIGVEPAFARQAVGRALLSQLFANLGSLRVERVQTEVAWNGFGLLKFLERSGFTPAQRLVFRRRVD